MIYLYGIGFDCVDSSRVASFWRRAVEYDEHDPTLEEIAEAVRLHPAFEGKAVVEDATARHPRFRMENVREPKVGRNRVRFEVGVPGDIEVEIGRLVELGATRLGHERMADPEGNEFEVGDTVGPRRFNWIVIDALDPAGQAEFWAQVFRWECEADRCFPPHDWLRIEDGSLFAFGRKIRDGFPGGAKPPEGAVHSLAPGLRFESAREPKSRKNRVHLDLVHPISREVVEAERARVFSLGASPEDPSTGHRAMFDPEGNEFCLH